MDVMHAQQRPVADDPERLLERHGDRLYRLALRITGVEEDAARAVEDAFLAVAGAMPKLAGEPMVESWILITAAKAAYQRLRARRSPVREITLDDVLPTLDGEGRHFDSVDDWSSRIHQGPLQGALRTTLAEAIDALPADDKTALVLHDLEGVSKRDIAEVLRIDVAGVNARVNRARLFVRKRLSEYFESAA